MQSYRSSAPLCFIISAAFPPMAPQSPGTLGPRSRSSPSRRGPLLRPSIRERWADRGQITITTLRWVTRLTHNAAKLLILLDGRLADLTGTQSRLLNRKGRSHRRQQALRPSKNRSAISLANHAIRCETAAKSFYEAYELHDHQHRQPVGSQPSAVSAT